MTTNVLSEKIFTEDLDINLEEKFHEKEVEQNKNHFNTNIFFLIAFMILQITRIILLKQYGNSCKYLFVLISIVLINDFKMKMKPFVFNSLKLLIQVFMLYSQFTNLQHNNYDAYSVTWVFFQLNIFESVFIERNRILERNLFYTLYGMIMYFFLWKHTLLPGFHLATILVLIMWKTKIEYDYFNNQKQEFKSLKIFQFILKHCVPDINIILQFDQTAEYNLQLHSTNLQLENTQSLIDYLNQINPELPQNIGVNFIEYLQTIMKIPDQQKILRYRIRGFITQNQKKQQTQFEIIRFNFENKPSIFISMINTSNHHNIEKKLQQDIEIKETLLQQVSHNLKNPLVASMYLTNQIITKYNNYKVFDIDQIQQISYNMEMALIQIYDTMDYTKIIKKCFTIQAQYFQLDIFLSSLTKLLQNILNNKNQKLIVDNTIKSNQCYNDKRRLTQVLFNLIENASKFSTYSQEITLKIRDLPQKNLLYFSVTDNGIGIQKEILEQLGKNVFSTDNQNFNFYGNGRGMFIVRNLIQAMGPQNGFIVNSKIQQGSEFKFFITLNSQQVDNILINQDNFNRLQLDIQENVFQS